LEEAETLAPFVRFATLAGEDEVMGLKEIRFQLFYLGLSWWPAGTDRKTTAPSGKTSPQKTSQTQVKDPSLGR
jgi:hypothetical protein